MHMYLTRFARNPLRVLVLTLLRNRPMSGIEIINQVELITGGLWRPSPGSVYPLLRELENEGLIEHTIVNGQKVYSLTDKGLVEVEECGLGIKPATIEDVIRVIEGYVDFLKDYVAQNKLNKEAKEKLMRIMKELENVASNP
ncbi:MAG: PadR family transcriptional regulator [Infirmifilum sp.]|uniref:PadR family transcriptional regulator n=1 Tax=Infirmifilum sp. TaxID=2856575 RepID=UPI003D0BA9C3